MAIDLIELGLEKTGSVGFRKLEMRRRAPVKAFWIVMVKDDMGDLA